MDWALPKLLAGPAALAVMTMVFLLHYLNRRQEHLKWWSLAWACYLARYLILLLAPDYQGLSPAFFIYASLVVPGSWLLYRGSAAFTGRPSRTWVAILLALTWAWVPAGLALGVPRWAATLPCAETVAFTYLLSGWLVLRDRKNELWCRVVAGTPFMIWGLLQSTFPLVGGTAPGITWGFLIAAVCEVWAATGLLMLFIHANLRELSLTRQALEAGERKLAQAFKVSPAAMFVSTLDQGRLLEVSDSAEQLTGYSKEEMIGRTTRELGLWDDPSKRDQLIAKLLEEGSIREFELTMRQRSGRMLTCLVSAELTRMDQERCVTLALMDITTLKRAEREMAQRLLYEEALAAAAQSLLTNWRGRGRRPGSGPAPSAGRGSGPCGLCLPQLQRSPAGADRHGHPPAPGPGGRPRRQSAAAPPGGLRSGRPGALAPPAVRRMAGDRPGAGPRPGGAGAHAFPPHPLPVGPAPDVRRPLVRLPEVRPHPGAGPLAGGRDPAPGHCPGDGGGLSGTAPSGGRPARGARPAGKAGAGTHRGPGKDQPAAHHRGAGAPPGPGRPAGVPVAPALPGGRALPGRGARAAAGGHRAA